MLTPRATKPSLQEAECPPTPQLAIVLYGNNEQQSELATLHKVKDNVMQQGKLTDIRNVRRTLTKQCNLIKTAQNRGIKLLPESVLVDSTDCLMWHTPAQKRTLWFSGSEVPVNVWIPSLVFYADPIRSLSLTVFAKANNKRPDKTTRLFHAPFMNLYSNGMLCQGSAKLPATRNINTIPRMENSLFDSFFTGVKSVADSNSQRIAHYNSNTAHLRYWREKEASGNKVRAKEMYFAKTFGQFITELGA